MATKNFIGCSVLFGSVSSVFKNINETNQRVELADLMATLAERQRAKVCLRGQGAQEEQSANCTCFFCSAQAQREKFGATFEEMDTQFAEDAAMTSAQRKTRYVRGMLAYERIRHDRQKSVAIKGLR